MLDSDGHHAPARYWGSPGSRWGGARAVRPTVARAELFIIVVYVRSDCMMRIANWLLVRPATHQHHASCFRFQCCRGVPETTSPGTPAAPRRWSDQLSVHVDCMCGLCKDGHRGRIEETSMVVLMLPYSGAGRLPGPRYESGEMDARG